MTRIFVWWIVATMYLLSIQQMTAQRLALKNSSLSASSTVFDNTSTKLSTQQVIGQSSPISVTGNARLRIFQGFLQPLRRKSARATPFDFKVYPNPSKGFVYLNFQSNISDKIEIKVLNLAGEMLISTSTDDQEPLLELTSLSSGIYMISVLTDKGLSSVHKIILE
jgi:hypothetical protein